MWTHSSHQELLPGWSLTVLWQHFYSAWRQFLQYGHHIFFGLPSQFGTPVKTTKTTRFNNLKRRLLRIVSANSRNLFIEIQTNEMKHSVPSINTMFNFKPTHINSSSNAGGSNQQHIQLVFTATAPCRTGGHVSCRYICWYSPIVQPWKTIWNIQQLIYTNAVQKKNTKTSKN